MFESLVITELEDNYMSYDFHAEIQSNLFDSNLVTTMNQVVKKFGHFSVIPGSAIISSVQQGVIRTNCLDCLDRTNAIQTLFAWKFLQPRISKNQVSSEFLELWVEHGDAISFAYTGTGSVMSRFLLSEGEDRLGSFIEQTWRGAERLYSHHFEANERETAIELILGNSSGSVRLNEFYSAVPTPITVFACTFNVNGNKRIDELFKSEEFCKQTRSAFTNASLVILAFQEIVALDISIFLFSGRKKTDERSDNIEKFLSVFLESNDLGSFEIVESVSMVGLCLTVLAKNDIIDQISNIKHSKIKLGSGGSTGNKGSVTVNLTIGETPLSIVNVHLESGHTKNDEREKQLEIVTAAHERNCVILGDFNFRLLGNLNAGAVVRHIERGNLAQLLDLDEVSGKQAISQGRYPGFREDYFEGLITFPPTYKFYSSGGYVLERCPSWCDRIFVKGTDKISEYFSIHLGKTEFISDHQPVCSILSMDFLMPPNRSKGRVKKPNKSLEPGWVLL
jgi:endonuclease/exonuclease/phosphatase family metal-dependent hydrolase